MGCNPFGRMISMAFQRKNGESRRSGRKKGWRQRRQEQYPMQGKVLPTIISHIGQPMVKSVIYKNDSPVTVMEPQTGHDPRHHHQEVVLAPSPHAYAAEVSAIEEAQPRPGPGRRVRFAMPESSEEAPPATAPATGGKQNEPYYHYYPQEPAGGPTYRYASSPLPAGPAEQRMEYFGGEYNYYPTPLREDIYRIADGNRLTTIFSDENPNACSIV